MQRTPLAEQDEYSSRLAPPRRVLTASPLLKNSGEILKTASSTLFENSGLFWQHNVNRTRHISAERDGYNSRLAPPKRVLEASPLLKNSGEILSTTSSMLFENSGLFWQYDVHRIRLISAERDGYTGRHVIDQQIVPTADTLRNPEACLWIRGWTHHGE